MDDYKNFAKSTLAAGIAADATSCTVAAGTGSRFPSTAFDAVIWDTSYTSATAAVLAGAGELVRVTSRSTDSLTITRAQGGTSAVAFNTASRTYAIAQVLTEAALEALAPLANGTHTGTTSVQVLSPVITDLGTFSSGTVTLSSTTAGNKAALTGTAATIALPSSPPDGGRFLNLATGASVVTVTVPSLPREDGDGVTAVTTVQFPANCVGTLWFKASGGSYISFRADASIIEILTSQLEAVSAGNLDSGDTSELARTVDVKAALDDVTLVDGLTSSAALGTDNAVVRADGVSRGTQSSDVTIDDDGIVTTPGDYVTEGEEPGSIQLADGDATSPETVTITAPEDITTSFVQQLPSAKGTGFLWGEVVGSVVVEYWDRRTITAGGTTGAQTINKPMGSVNFAAAATSLVVTNSLVTTSSVILVTVATNDSTMKTATAVAGAGSFTIYANAAATGETRVNFVVF